VHRWDIWKSDIPSATADALEGWAKRWWDDPSCWHVVERAITTDEWVEVVYVGDTPEPPRYPRPPTA
jgi:hypothetical protein